MKHRISKVALIATLAFIGVGFAGTQQAKAGPCMPDYCGGDSCTYTTVIGADGISYSSPCPEPPASCVRGTPLVERYLSGTGCLDCFGTCAPTMRDKYVQDTTCVSASGNGTVTCPDFHCYKKYTMGTAGTCPTRPKGDTNVKGLWY